MNARLFIPLMFILALAGFAGADGPALNPIGNKTVNAGEQLKFEITSTLPDNGATIFLKNVTFGTLAWIGNTTAEFSWTPATGNAGRHSVLFTAMDSNSTTTQAMTIRVNRKPQITSAEKTSAIAGILYTYDVDATDPDGDTLTYALLTAPTGMSINSINGMINWTPKSTGDFAVGAQVSDGNAAVYQNFTINVPSRLHIERVEVTVDGDKQTIDAGERVDNIHPESKVEFEVKVENLFTDEEDVRIKDIKVEITIKEIEEGEDDLEETFAEFDLDPEDNKKATILFSIPLEVDAKSHDVMIEVTGEDDNDIKHKEEFLLELEVEKKSHDVIIKTAEFSPSTARCSEFVSLNVGIINFGESEEDDVEIEAVNPFGEGKREKDIGLGNDLAKELEDARYEATFNFDIPKGKEGTNYFDVKVYRSGDILEAIKRVELPVICEAGRDGLPLGEEAGESEIINPGDTKRLSKEKPLIMALKGKTHNLLVTTISGSRAGFVFRSAQTTFSLAVGQAKRIDSDADGNDDMVITLLDIKNGFVDVLVQEITRGEEQATISYYGGIGSITGETTGATVPVSGEEITGAEEKKVAATATPLVIGVAVINIILILVVVFVVMRFIKREK